MDDCKQYSKTVVINVINFMAMAGSGLLSEESTIEMLHELPEDLHADILVALIAARETKKVGMMAKLASIFPMEEILKDAMGDAKRTTKFSH